MNPPPIVGNVRVAECPSREIMDHLTSRWGVLVLVVLRDGTLRFSELRQRIGGVSEKMLAQSLRVLEHDGFVARRAYPEVPPRVEYSLTPLGMEASTHLDTLTRWIEANLGRVQEARERGEPVAP